MANHLSTKKDIRKAARRKLVNRERKAVIKEAVKAVEKAMHNVQKEGVQHLEVVTLAFRNAQSKITSTKSGKILKPRAAAKKISSLAKKIKQLSIQG